jgi:hypothetical protein
MFYVGGSVEHSNIELHDVRFTVGKSAKDCHDDLRAQWWGTPDSLHVDSWYEVNQVDGYDITLSHEPQEGPEKLFFINLGGYTNGVFEEAHANVLAVATSQKAAIQRSIQAQSSWTQPHKDRLMQLEKVLSVSETIQNGGLHIHLQKADVEKPMQFVSKYISLKHK